MCGAALSSPICRFAPRKVTSRCASALPKLKFQSLFWWKLLLYFTTIQSIWENTSPQALIEHWVLQADLFFSSTFLPWYDFPSMPAKSPASRLQKQQKSQGAQESDRERTQLLQPHKQDKPYYPSCSSVFISSLIPSTYYVPVKVISNYITRVLLSNEYNI